MSDTWFIAINVVVKQILRYIGASDGNMAEGSMRLDVNISLRPKGEKELRPKVEVKNVNSFKSVQQAVDFECLRQSKAYDEGEVVRQETRMWDEKGEAVERNEAALIQFHHRFPCKLLVYLLIYYWIQSWPPN